MRHAPLKTLAALTVAAGFGGFAATAMRDGLETPAHAAPSRRPLPCPRWRRCPPRSTARRCRRWRRCSSASRRRWSACTPSSACGSAIRSPTTRCSAACSRNVPQERINQSLGSGVIVDAAKGLVLTNHHVIEGADEVSVTLVRRPHVPGHVRRLRSGHRRRADADPGRQAHRLAARRIPTSCASAISSSRSAIRSASARR